jgi:hypothetical protein
VAGRLILTLAAMALLAAGIAAMFAPDELGQWLSGSRSPGLSLAIQLAGSGLLGFACLDWMSRGNRIGGIYGRPVAIANLALCTTAAFALGKAAVGSHHPAAIATLAIAFGALALAFAWLAFAHDPLD